MPLYIGDKKITKILVGDKEVTKMFFGDEEVSPEPGPGPTPGVMTFTYNLTDKVWRIYELIEDATSYTDWVTGPAPETVQKSSYDFVAYGDSGSWSGNTYPKYNFSTSDLSVTGCTVSNIRITTATASSTGGGNSGAIRFTLSDFTDSVVVNLDASATPTIACFLEGTKVLLADGTYKNIEDVDYNDLLLTYDPYLGKVTSQYPLLIERGLKGCVVNSMDFTLDDDSTITVCGGHNVYDMSKNRFVNVNADNFDDIDWNKFKFAKYENDGFSSVGVKEAKRHSYDPDEYTAYAVYLPMHGSIITNDVLTGGNLLIDEEIESVLKANKNTMYWDESAKAIVDSVGIDVRASYEEWIKRYSDKDVMPFSLFACSTRRCFDKAVEMGIVPAGYHSNVKKDEAFLWELNTFSAERTKPMVVRIDDVEYVTNDTFRLPDNLGYSSYIDLSTYVRYYPNDVMPVLTSTRVVGIA